MKMQRHYLISNDLDDLEVLEDQLESAGITQPQIHVLSMQDADVERHPHLHHVPSLARSDLIYSTARGALVGVLGFVFVLAVAYFAGWTQTAAGWMPFVFLAIIILGFCTWEGGLWGIQRPNHNFRRFENALKDGKHVFYLDLEPQQETVLQDVLRAHPNVELAGLGSSPHWLIRAEQKLLSLRHAWSQP